MATYMDIPEVIRGIILNKIPQNESLNLRLVSKEWNNDMNNYYLYDVNDLDEDTLEFQYIVRLHIKSLKIKKLLKTSELGPKKKCIFQYPNAIKILKIGSHDHPSLYIKKEITNPISPRNLQSLLEVCSDRLEELNLEFGRIIFTSQLHWNIVYNFKSLKTVTLFLSKLQRKLPENASNSTSFIQQLSISLIPQLRHLDIDFFLFGFNGQNKSGIIKSILKFIHTKGTNLQSMKFQLHPKGRLESLSPHLHPIEYFPEISNDLDLVKQKLTTLTDILIGESPNCLANSNFWIEFLSDQTHLVNVHLPFDVPLISPNSCQQLLNNNFLTLARIDIQSLTMKGVNQPFDLAIFNYAENLSELILSNISGIEIPPGSQEARHFVNFHRLPQNLTLLSLSKLRVLTQELGTAFSKASGRGFKKLQRLNLKYCGSTDDFGITGTILETINVNAESLKKIVLIESANRTNLIELVNLKYCLIGLVISDTSHITLQKIDADIGWQNIVE